MTPDERREIYPPFIVREIEKESSPGFQRTKVTDFLQLIRAIWVLSNKDYQERFWIRQELPIRGDNYMETMEEFLSTGRGVLKENKEDLIEMSSKQRKMLQKLYSMIDAFTEDPKTPGSDYGENDEAIVNDPNWQKIGEYGKLVYEELSGDDLEKWEKSRLKQQTNKPLDHKT